MVRWQPGSFPPKEMRVRDGRARSLVPAYKDPSFALTAPVHEREFLAEKFRATKVTATPTGVRQLLRSGRFDLLHFSGHGAKVVLAHSTHASGLRMAAGMDHLIMGPPGTQTGSAESSADLGRVTITADVEPGQRLRVVKFLAYGWSSQRSEAALRDQVAAALAEAGAGVALDY